MSSFSFGTRLMGARGEMLWDPDAEFVGNAHLIISGESGSGKSHLLRKVVKWLATPTPERLEKHIYVLDLHGDLGIEGVDENLIEFTGRNSPHGINPFEFDPDERNGGCGVQVDVIVTMIKKAFLPKMGSRQEALLRQLIMDCYRVKGITDEDPSTWDRELPSLETLLQLIRQILDHLKNSGGRIAAMVQKMDAVRRSIEKEDSAGYFRKALIEAGIEQFEKAAVQEMQARDTVMRSRQEKIAETERKISALKKKAGRLAEAKEELALLEAAGEPESEEEGKKRSRRIKSLTKTIEGIDSDALIDEREMLENRVASLQTQNQAEPSDDYIYDRVLGDILDEAWDESAPIHGEKTAKSILSKLKQLDKIRGEIDFLLRRYTSYCKSGAFAPMFGNELPEEIDPNMYSSANSIASLEGLELYISVAAQSGIFSAKKPPVKPGLNRLDISGLSSSLASFFVDTFVNRIYLTMKRRGEYGGGPRGKKCDTYIVIDEGASILPSGRELNSNKFILNKGMQELRKFGVGIIFVSQSPSHFSSPLLSAYTKAVLKLAPDVTSAARKCLGIKDQSLFQVIETPRTALVEMGEGFVPVGLDGYDPQRLLRKTNAVPQRSAPKKAPSFGQSWA